MLSNRLLLSIKPQYARKIFDDKTKKVELRRLKPQLTKGDVVIVYVTAPVQKFIGFFEVDNIIEKPLSFLHSEITNFWEEVKDIAGINEHDFRNYYYGASLAVGICFTDAIKFNKPIKLNHLQSKLSLKPPQSYRYLTQEEYETIMLLGGMKIKG